MEGVVDMVADRPTAVAAVQHTEVEEAMEWEEEALVVSLTQVWAALSTILTSARPS